MVIVVILLYGCSFMLSMSLVQWLIVRLMNNAENKYIDDIVEYLVRFFGYVASVSNLLFCSQKLTVDNS